MLVVIGQKYYDLSPDSRIQWVKNVLLPPDPVILAVITRSTPQATMLPVEVDGVDRAAGAVVEGEGVPHSLQFLADFFGGFIIQQELAGLGLAVFDFGTTQR